MSLSSLQKDFVVNYLLRSQLGTLQNVLEEMENSDNCEDVYVTESLNRVEKELRRARKMFKND